MPLVDHTTEEFFRQMTYVGKIEAVLKLQISSSWEIWHKSNTLLHFTRKKEWPICQVLCHNCQLACAGQLRPHQTTAQRLDLLCKWFSRDQKQWGEGKGEIPCVACARSACHLDWVRTSALNCAVPCWSNFLWLFVLSFWTIWIGKTLLRIYSVMPVHVAMLEV